MSRRINGGRVPDISVKRKVIAEKPGLRGPVRVSVHPVLDSVSVKRFYGRELHIPIQLLIDLVFERGVDKDALKYVPHSQWRDPHQKELPL